MRVRTLRTLTGAVHPSMPVNVVLRHVRDFYCVSSVYTTAGSLNIVIKSGSHTTTTAECLHHWINRFASDALNLEKPVFIEHTNSKRQTFTYDVENCVSDEIRLMIFRKEFNKKRS